MGLADRECDELRGPDPWPAPLNEDFGRKATRRGSHLPPWAWAVLLAVAMFGSPAAHRWWQASQAADLGAVGTPQVVPAALPPRQATLQTFESAPPAPSFEFPAETRVVAKCVVNGRATYTAQGNCQAGTVVSVPIAASPSADDIRAAQVRAEELAEQAAEIDRQAAWRAWHREQELANASPPANLTKTAQCADLEQQIQGLDAQAREPQSAGMQDWLKDRRVQIRSRQFALHC